LCIINRFFFLLKIFLVLVLVVALLPQTPKHIRGGWSHYTDTSEPVDGNWDQNISGIKGVHLANSEDSANLFRQISS
jgi:hypothetical protein